MSTDLPAVLWFMRLRRPLLALTLACAAGCSAGPGAHAQPTAPPSPTAKTATSASGSSTAGAAVSSGPCGTAAKATYRHVVWIWMENRTYTQVLGSGQASHLASYARRCGVATNYHALTHPSLPNYIAAVTGGTHGITSDCDPSACPVGSASIYGQMQRSGRQWRGYAESMPTRCDRVSAGRYAARHNPAVYLTRIRHRCRRWDVPFGGSRGAFASALSNDRLPAFTFVTPDLCDDGHDCSLSRVNDWLGTWLPRIVASPDYAAGHTAVFVTWDEGIGSDNQVAAVVIAPSVPPGTRAGRRFTHYSLLRTTESLLGVRALGRARSAASMRRAFHL